MKRNIQREWLVAALLALLASGVASAQVDVSYRYSLSDFSGTIPYSAARIRADRHHGEVYVATGDEVRVFNDAGMEIYRFGPEHGLGLVRDLEVEPSGDILVLSHQSARAGVDTTYTVTRCDYRGQPLQVIEIYGQPAPSGRFIPDRMFRLDDGLLLASRHDLRAILVGIDGRFEAAYDLAALIGVEDKDRDSDKIAGFTVDAADRMVFTVPTLFRAYIVSLDRKVEMFGSSGSAPGEFGVVQGIAVDDDGNYLVADRLRSVVMVFTPRYRFVSEFGYRGHAPENLAGPKELALGDDHRVYVTQLANRGISVFSVAPDQEISR